MANLGFLNFLSGATQGFAGAQQQQQQMRADRDQQLLEMMNNRQMAQLQHQWEVEAAQRQFGYDKILQQMQDEDKAKKDDSAKTPYTFADFYIDAASVAPAAQRAWVSEFNRKNKTNYPMPGEVRNGIHIGFYGDTPMSVMQGVANAPSGFGSPTSSNAGSQFLPPITQNPYGGAMPPHMAIDQQSPTAPYNLPNFTVGPANGVMDFINPLRRMTPEELMNGE